MTPAFIAGVLALCLAVGGGTYWFAGSGGTLDDVMTGTLGPFTSAADGACKDQWIASARNGPALVCYLTTNVSRLCDPREKKHLAKVIRAFRNDVVAMKAKSTLGGLTMAVEVQSPKAMKNMVTMSQSVAKQSENQDYKLSAEEQKAFDEHFEMVGRMEATARNLNPNAGPPGIRIPDEELVKKIRRLGAAGYVSKGDFGWFPDPLVSEAFKNVKVSGAPCSKT